MKKILLSIAFVFTLMCCAFSQASSDSYSGGSSFTHEDIKVTVYPNPASDYINLQDRTNTVSNVNIFDLAGRKIKSFKTEGGQMLNIVDLPKGIYLIQFLDKKEKLVSTQRLSKK